MNKVYKQTQYSFFMELNQYLKELETCPDELLEKDRERPIWRVTAELGVYDNWPILLNINFERFLKDIEGLDFKIVERRNNIDTAKHTRVISHYKPGTVIMQILDYVAPGWVIPDFISEEDNKRQIKDYSISMMLHPYQVKKTEGISENKALAQAIQKIGEYAIINNIPLCFPRSRGEDNFDDLSRIVYHPLN